MKCGGEIMDRKKEWLCYLLNDCEHHSKGVGWLMNKYEPDILSGRCYE